MKNIEDYLHFYLGCEAYVFPDETLTNGWLAEKLKEIPRLEYKIPVTLDRVKYIIECGYKPILRQLNDMTEEEKAEMLATQEEVKLVGYPEIVLKVDSGETFRYMLSKGFDLFDLIPEGLAIDGKTLKPE